MFLINQNPLITRTFFYYLSEQVLFSHVKGQAKIIILNLHSQIAPTILFNLIYFHML